MYQDHLHVCLFQPEIPQNTGNIGRLCAATQCRLHLITPLGFSTDDKNLLRAGLDYWPYLDLEVHKSLEDLLSRFEPNQVAFFSKLGKKSYRHMSSDIKLIIFGRETSGFPSEIHQRHADQLYQVPMFHTGVRSLNLANCVSIVTYHQLLERVEVNPL